MRVFFFKCFTNNSRIASGFRKSQILNSAPSIAVFTFVFSSTAIPKASTIARVPYSSFKSFLMLSKSLVELTSTIPSGFKPLTTSTVLYKAS